MSTETIPTAEHLTQLLGCGRVTSVTADSTRDTIVSRIVRLRLAYDGPSDGPTSLLMKTAHPTRNNDGGGRQEIAFYNHVAPAMPAGMVPRCFEAQRDDTTGAWHILLEDLADTHVVATVWPIPPNTAQCEAIVDAWARFHALGWDNPQLNVSIGTVPDEAAHEGFLRDLAERFARFVDLLGDRLTTERRQRFERLLAEGSRLLGRARRPNHLTLVHRDAHVWNCFLPRDGGSDVRIFDWDSWRIGIATSDLAYMMATHWYPERRRRLEVGLLDRYHAALLAHGVTTYDRAMLAEDYRWSALWQITTPIWQATYDIPPLIWWSHHERTMAAFEDLGCADFL